jgi:hypothetical protein
VDLCILFGLFGKNLIMKDKLDWKIMGIDSINEANHIVYGKICVGDTIEWGGTYSYGYDSGVNKIVRIFIENKFIWFELDNGKVGIINNLRKPDEIPDSTWKKL